MFTGKLVRDHIPDIIRAAGKLPELREADPSELQELLVRKLVEEVDEFLEDRTMEELVDILEVVRAIAAGQGVNHQELEALRERKHAERGGFTVGYIWLGNREQ